MTLPTGVCRAIALATLVLFTLVTNIDALVSKFLKIDNFFALKISKLNLFLTLIEKLWYHLI